MYKRSILHLRCGLLSSVLFAAALSIVACGEGIDDGGDEFVDGKDDSAFAGGKADDFFGDCEQEHILLLLNDPGTDSDRLFETGVHRRAANNLEAYRAGSDGELATDDDQYFRSLEEVDQVYFVGPVAMHQLATAIGDYCQDSLLRVAETIFSPQPYYDSHIDRAVEMIDSAEASIDMAMYSFSDSRAMSALGDAVDRGVRVRLLFDSANGDHLDTEGSRSAALEEMGVDVRYINRIMHHKFAIIDGPQDELLQASDARIFSGSANLSFGGATRYDENTTFHDRDPAFILHMQREFNHLWEHSRDLEWNDDLVYFETLPIVAEMIPPRPGLEVLFTSENFETTYSSHWGHGFRPIEFSQVVAERLVELIASADSSIYVAASFLRSRPISEALIERWHDEPSLDIRVYMDQSEYISRWYHDRQLDDLADCLEEADDDPSEVFDCEQRGFIFSYALEEAEIPIRFKNYAYRWHYTYALQMHHKFMIIDEHTVATGSYNFSNNAEQNTMENVVVYKNPYYEDVVQGFLGNFETIWQTGRDEGLYEALIEEIEEAEVIDLIFEPAALTHQEITDLRRLIRQRCPEVDSEDYRINPQDNTTCTVQ